jgi:hypothetical protein
MFINEEDLGNSIYDDVLQAVAREDQNFINDNIYRAITEADSYMNQTYDTTSLWNQTGEDRNRLIKGVVIDMAIYHIYSVAEETPVIRRERYDYAKDILKRIMRGEIVLEFPRKLDEDKQDCSIKYGGIDRKY